MGTSIERSVAHPSGRAGGEGNENAQRKYDKNGLALHQRRDS